MIPRPFYREKLIFVVILCTVLVFLIYLYSNQEPRAEQWPSGRCIAELASLKYQLNGKNFLIIISLQLKVYEYQNCVKIQ